MDSDDRDRLMARMETSKQPMICTDHFDKAMYVVTPVAEYLKSDATPISRVRKYLLNVHYINNIFSMKLHIKVTTFTLRSEIMHIS